MESLRGHFLIANTDADDVNFRASVVLITNHSDEGAEGYVLTKPTIFRMEKIWRELTKKEIVNPYKLFYGGPVDGPIVAVHGLESHSEHEILSDVYMTYDIEKLESLLTEKPEACRFFFNYSGWGPGQLESELNRGYWYVLPATADLVFSNSDTLWRRAADEFGKKIFLSTKSVGIIPIDPSLN